MNIHLLPGTSGVLSPFGKIDGLYFNNSDEPNKFMYDFKNEIKDILKSDDVDYIELQCDNKEDYYNLLAELSKMSHDSITVSGTSKNKLNIIIEDDKDIENEDDDE